MGLITDTKDNVVIQRFMNGALIALTLGSVMFGVSFVVFGIGKVAPSEYGLGWSAVKIILLVVAITSCYIWCLLDSVLNDYPFGKHVLFIFIVILPIALILYFYRSRGFKNGSIIFMKALAFFAFLNIVAGISGVLASRIVAVSV